MSMTYLITQQASVNAFSLFPFFIVSFSSFLCLTSRSSYSQLFMNKPLQPKCGSKSITRKGWWRQRVSTARAIWWNEHPQHSDLFCGTWVQNMPCLLSWNFSYQNVWDFKEAESKILCVKCWSSRMTEQRQVTFLHTFQSAKLFHTKVILRYWRQGPHHTPRDQNASDYEKFCLVTTTLSRKLFYISSNSVLRYTTIWIFHASVWKPYQKQLQTSISTRGLFFSFSF